MDISMPVMDGYEATRAIRDAGANYDALPIVALTAHVDGHVREKCLDGGFNDVVTKPFRCAALLKTVGYWLRDAAAEQLIPFDEEKDASTDASEIAMPMNYEQAVDEFDGDRELVDSILQQIVEELETQLARIHHAYSVDDTQTLAQEAHKIKGASGNLVALPLSEAARVLEERARSGVTPEDACRHLDYEFSRFKHFVAALNIGAQTA